jgi:hypothetical protein
MSFKLVRSLALVLGVLAMIGGIAKPGFSQTGNIQEVQVAQSSQNNDQLCWVVLKDKAGKIVAVISGEDGSSVINLASYSHYKLNFSSIPKESFTMTGDELEKLKQAGQQILDGNWKPET